jgi:low affinity Fe/Cu permease
MGMLAGTLLILAATDLADRAAVRIDTAISIVAFLFVFLIYRDEHKARRALNGKLDALIQVTDADDTLRGIEEKSEPKLYQLTE